jgi:hypothetical protein
MRYAPLWMCVCAFLSAEVSAQEMNFGGYSFSQQGKKTKKSKKHKKRKKPVVPAPIVPESSATPSKRHSRKNHRPPVDEEVVQDESGEAKQTEDKEKDTDEKGTDEKGTDEKGTDEKGTDEKGTDEATANGEDASGSGEEEEGQSSGLGIDGEIAGYIRGRYTLAFVDPHALLSGIVPLLPGNFGVLEVNTQPKLRLFSNHFTLAADLSVLATTPQQPYVQVALSEIYMQVSVADSVYIMLGRRRVVWGTGLSWNPTDLVNPPRDLLEPVRTRAGALMLPMVDVALSAVTLSAFMSAPVTYNTWGLPTHISINQPVFGARAFTNQIGTDWSLMYFYDVGKKRNSLGGAFSSVLFDVYELHAEAILHIGEVDRPPLATIQACGPGIDTPQYGGAAVLGGRRDWNDRSLVALEFLYNSAGYSPADYALVRTELPCLRAAAAVAQAQDPTRPPIITQQMVLARQFYLSVLAQRPHITEEGWLEHVGVSGGAIMSLSDASSILQARVDVSFGAFVLSLIGVVWVGPGGGEVDLMPTRALASADFQWSY